MIRLCGYILYPKITITAMFIFLGEGSNGKGILTEIISSFFPSKFLSDLSLSAISREDSMNRTQLITSKLNISTEEKGEKIPTEEIKKITDGERISIARKYLENISIRPHCKLLLSNNQMPYFNDSSYGIMRRVKMFNFLNQFLEEREYEKVSKAEQRRIFKGQPKQELLDMIELEKPAILNLFIQGLKDMKADKWRFLESENMTKIKEEYKDVNDPLGQWLVDNYELGDELDFIGVIYIFNEFNDFYMANNTKKSPYSTNFISRKIKDKFRIESMHKKEKDSLNDWRTITGFCLKKRVSNEPDLMADLKF